MNRSRWWLLVGVLVVLVVVPFCLWGEWFDRFFDLSGAKRWLEGLGPWAWMGGMALLVADVALPVPGTVVMTALGLVYGWFWGGVISAAGSALGGILAYGLCRWLGRRAALWLAGEEGLRKGERWFVDGRAGWLVALSRWMPLMAEVVACLAGLVRVPWRTFLTALLAGSVPLGFVFAGIGALGVERPALAMGLGAAVAAALGGAAAWGVGKSNGRTKD